MKVRVASKEDIEAYSDMAPKPTLKAWAGEVDGEIVALGGIAFAKGRWFAFCDLKEGAKDYPMTIMRTAKKVFEYAREKNIRFVYAEADPDEPKAVRWMESLGFQLDPRSQHLYRWRA